MLAANAISKTEINAELESILSGKSFRKSPLLSRFLRFVVEKSIDGQANQIKEYTVGISALDKPNGFNPQTDASVRINAIRLRKLLNEYYQEHPADSPLRINLPKGSYCPEFYLDEARLGKTVHLQKTVSHSPSAESICVVPFTGMIENSSLDFSVEGFSARLSDRLSLFQDIRVKSHSSVISCLQDGVELEKLGPTLKVTYYLTGSVEITGHHILASVQLFDAGCNSLIWSHEFPGEETNGSQEEILQQVASKIVSSLAGYSGFLHHKFFDADVENASGPANAQANAVYWYYHFQTRLSEKIFQEAIKQLEKVTHESPDCDLCWAILAQLYTSGIIYHFDSGVENPLARAKAYLARSFAINPNGQQSYLTLAWIYLFLGNKAEAKIAIKKAAEINPYSSYAMAVSSLVMSLLGEYDAAGELMEKAILLNPLPYWWFNLPPIFTALKAGDFEKMLFYARKTGTPAGIHEHIFEMIALFYLGQTKGLKIILEHHRQKFPEGIAHALKTWQKILFDAELVEKLVFALRKINLL